MSLDLSFGFAKENSIAFDESSNKILITESTPFDAILEIKNKAKKELIEELTITNLEQENFQKELERIYSSKNDMSHVSNLDYGSLDNLMSDIQESEDLLSTDSDAPIVKLLNGIFLNAINLKASDIHIEPFEKSLRIRFRIDGVLRNMLSPPANIGNMLTSRVKVMARLDIAEKRLPQDGRISLKLGDREIDLRVSTIPSNFGERIVLRILEKNNEIINVKRLGMPEDVLAAFTRIINKPHGVFLVTGPTGSGKSTTLYAAINQINDIHKNIMTIEDPVEYNLPGINQTQVNTKSGMTFARGLRSILRQDPDIVMLGEVRDMETAEITIQASLTGHLVFSTLHTNTAIGAINRLKDMEIEPFLLASSLIGVLSQRLVRKLCSNCKEAVKLKDIALDSDTLAELKDIEEIYLNKGCSKCGMSGYQGRIAIFEMIEIDEVLKQMIISGETEIAMRKYITSIGIKSIQQNGLSLVKQGLTSLEEIVRVTN